MSIHTYIKTLCKEPRYELGRAVQAHLTIDRPATDIVLSDEPGE